MQGKPSRPSAAMILAVLALTGAVAGTAVAGPDAFTSGALTKKKVKKIARKQAQKEIAKIKHAYATIDGDGTVRSDAPSKNITSGDIDTPLTGFYCFELPFDPVAAASNEAGGGVEDGLMAVKLASTDYDECPQTADAEVSHYDTSAADFSTDPFIIQFDG
jgi:hypothetical protein